MEITMLENLFVSDNIIQYLFAPLKPDGHELTINLISGNTDENKVKGARNAKIIIITNGSLSEKVITSLPDLEMISVGFTGLTTFQWNYVKKKELPYAMLRDMQQER